MITTTEPKPRTVRGMTLRELLRNGRKYSQEKLTELARRSGVATDCKMAVRLSEKQMKDVPKKPVTFFEFDNVRDSMVNDTKMLVQFEAGIAVTFADRSAIEWLVVYGSSRVPSRVPAVHFECGEQMDSDLVDLALVMTCERLACRKSVLWATVVQIVPGKTKRSKPVKTTMKNQIGMVDAVTGESLAVVMLISQDK